jgi:hypothetical protein
MKSTAKKVKKRRGRPPTGSQPLVGVRLPQDAIDIIEELAQNQKVGRSVIVRQLVLKAISNLKLKS